MSITWVAALVFILNLPFGYWRAHQPKFSRGWFLAVHAPVPLVIAIRLLSGLGFHLITFPIMIGAYFAGQFAGGKFHDLRTSRTPSRVTSCLVWDLVGKSKAF